MCSCTYSFTYTFDTWSSFLSSFYWFTIYLLFLALFPPLLPPFSLLASPFSPPPAPFSFIFDFTPPAAAISSSCCSITSSIPSDPSLPPLPLFLPGLIAKLTNISSPLAASGPPFTISLSPMMGDSFYEDYWSCLWNDEIEVTYWDLSEDLAV